MPFDEYLKSVLEAIGANNQSGALPEPDEISYYVLEKERKIYLDFDVGSTIIFLHRLIMRWNMQDKGLKPEERKPIWLYIMSYGGDLAYMWALIDAMQASETPVYTVNIGVAGSAAALIFMAGKKRYMMKNSQLVVHEGYAEMSGDAVKVMDATDAYKNELKKMKDFIEQQTKIPHAKIIKKRNNDWYLDANFCLDNGACEVIIDSLSEVI